MLHIGTFGAFGGSLLVAGPSTNAIVGLRMSDLSRAALIEAIAEVDSLRAELAAAEKRHNRLRSAVSRVHMDLTGQTVAAADLIAILKADAALATAEQDEPRTSLARVLTLADGWDGGATQGRAHITRCVRVHPCPQCLLAEAAMDLREAVTCTHEWVKMPNLKWDVCVQCGIERRNSGNCRTVSRPEPTPEQP